MKRNTPPTPAAPPPARTRAAKTQAAQPSLFALETVKTNPAVSVPVRAERPRARTSAAPRPMPTASATKPVKPIAKIAITNSVPATPLKAPARAVTKETKQKIAKTNPAAKQPVPKAQPVRVVNDPVFEGGALWKMSGKNGVAYIKDAALAGELLAIDPKKLAQAAMAVYYDKKGRPFAWQVRFDTDRWEEVLRRLA